MAMNPRAKRWLKRLGLAALVIAVLLLLLLAGVVLALNTQWGRDTVTSLVNEQASTPSMSIHLEGLESVMPWDLRLASLTLADAEGVWLSASDLSVSVELTALLRKAVVVDHITLERLEYIRPPLPGEEKKEPEPPQPISLEIPEIPHVRIDTLRVGELLLHLPPPDTGEQAPGEKKQVAEAIKAFTINGGIRPEGQDFVVQLDVRELAEQQLAGKEAPPGYRPDSLQLQARLQQPDNILAIDLSLEEGSGGLAGAALGLGPQTPVSGGLQGKGSLKDWRGDLRLDVGDAHLLTGGLSLKMDQQAGLFHAGLKGELQDPAGLLPQDIVQFSGERADYAIELTLPLDGDLQKLARLDALRLETSTAKLQLDAVMQQGELSANVSLDVLETSLLPQLTGKALSGAPSLTASLDGNQDAMTLKLRSSLGQLALPELSSQPATLQTTVTVKAPLDPGRTIAATGSLDVTGLQPPAPYTLDEKLTLAFDLALPDQSSVRINSLELHNGENTLTAKGDVDLQRLQVDAELAADLPHAGALLALHPLDAAITLQAKAKGAMASGIDARLSGSLKKIKGLEPQLAALLGDALDLQAHAFVDENTVQLHDLGVSGRTSLQASGQYGLQEQALEAQLTVTPPQTLALPDETGGPDTLQLQGLEPLEITASGSLQKRMEAHVALSADLVQLPDRQFHNLSLKLAAGVPLTPAPEEDKFSLDLKTREIALNASSRYQLEPETLHLRELTITGPDTKISGSLRLGLKDMLAAGNIDLKASRLAAYQHLLGMQLAGALDASLKLSTPDNRQAATLALSGNSIAAAGAELASFSLNASTADAFAIAAGHGQAELKLTTGKAGVEAAYAESLSLDASLRQGKVTLKLDTKGQADKPFDLKLAGVITPGAERQELRLDSLSGSYAAVPLKLRSPVTVVSEKGRIDVNALSLGLDSATLHADGSYGPQNVGMKLRLEALQFTSLKPLLPPKQTVPDGRLDLQVELDGALSAPDIKATLSVKDVAMPVEDQDDPDLPPLDVNLTANLKGGQLQADGTVAYPYGELATVSAGLPMRLALQPFAFELKENAPIQAKVKGGFRLKHLENVLGLTDQLLDGSVSYDIAASGKLDQPDVAGQVKLKKGHYENLKTGTLLTDLKLQLTAKGDRFELTELSAHDKQGGTLSGKGKVTLSDDYPFSAKVDINKFSPAHMDMFQGKLSGTVELKGDAKQGGDIEGWFKILGGEVNIPKNLPPDVANVDVIQKNDGSEPVAEQEEKQEQKKKAFPMRLDIQVELPGRFFVRGMGLDSEWGGNLKVSGTAASPRIVGVLAVQRGSFEFLDKVFTIKEGKIRFSGGAPPSPVLNIVTSTQTGDIEALVIISGTAQNLKITFDSNPPMPQNEILSAVLFGRSTDSLTPLQAIRLARALDQISGGATGSSLDVMQSLKTILHVDEISAGEGESGDMTLQAGKYITDDVYLKGTKGLNPRDDSLSLEVEITPNLGLESQMGGDSQGGVGLNWRYDY